MKNFLALFSKYITWLSVTDLLFMLGVACCFYAIVWMLVRKFLYNSKVLGSNLGIVAKFWFAWTHLLLDTTLQRLSVASRSTRPEVLCKIGLRRNIAKFTGKHLCQSLFFNKVADLPTTLLKKRLWHRYFPVNIAKFLRKPFLTVQTR